MNNLVNIFSEKFRYPLSFNNIFFAGTFELFRHLTLRFSLITLP